MVMSSVEQLGMVKHRHVWSRTVGHGQTLSCMGVGGHAWLYLPMHSDSKAPTAVVAPKGTSLCLEQG